MSNISRYLTAFQDLSFALLAIILGFAWKVDDLLEENCSSLNSIISLQFQTLFKRNWKYTLTTRVIFKNFTGFYNSLKQYETFFQRMLLFRPKSISRWCLLKKNLTQQSWHFSQPSSSFSFKFSNTSLIWMI